MTDISFSWTIFLLCESKLKTVSVSCKFVIFAEILLFLVKSKVWASACRVVKFVLVFQ